MVGDAAYPSPTHITSVAKTSFISMKKATAEKRP
jgi:hypothetical protein